LASRKFRTFSATRTNEKDLPYAAAYPEDAKDPKPASTPSWAPDHIYPHIPAWNPASTVEDHEWTVSTTNPVSEETSI